MPTRQIRSLFFAVCIIMISILSITLACAKADEIRVKFKQPFIIREEGGTKFSITFDGYSVIKNFFNPNVSKIIPIYKAPKGKNLLLVTLSAKNLGPRNGIPIIDVAEVKLDNGNIYGRTGSSIGSGKWPDLVR